MKTLRVFLAGSLLANAMLLFAWMKLRSREGEAKGEVSRASTDAKTPPESNPAGTWSQIDSADFGELAARLKTSGFSPDEIRAIIGWRIAEKYPPSFRTDGSTPYWRNSAIDYSDPKIREEQHVQMMEQHELYRKYVGNGESLATNPDALEAARQRFGPKLSAEKLQAISAIEDDYMVLSWKHELERMRRGSERMDAADQEARALLEKEKGADIAKLLTPEEYADYELRNSPAATSLRYRLQGFQPSEEEFKTLFALNKPFEEKLRNPKLPPDERKALLDQMSTQIASALGSERMADYLESQRGSDETARLIARLGLPARANAQVRTLREDLAQRANVVRQNDQLSPMERSGQLGALVQEARTQLTTLLGEKGFEAYDDLKGEWIRELQAVQGKR